MGTISTPLGDFDESQFTFPPGATPEQKIGFVAELHKAGKLKPPVGPVEDVARGTAAGIGTGVVAGTVGMPGDVQKLLMAVSGKKDFGRFPIAPSSEEIVKDTWAGYKPHSETGKAVKDTTAGVGAMLPGGAGTAMLRMILGAFSGAGGHFGEKAAGPGGGLAGSLIPGLAPLYTMFRTPNIVKATKDLVKDVPSGGLEAAAKKAKDAGDTLGTKTLLTQGLDRPGGMSALTQEIMADPRTGKEVRRILEGQFGAGQEKIDSIVRALSRREGDQESANSLVTAINSALDRPLDIAAKKAAPHYAAAKGEAIDPVDVENLADVVQRAAREKGLGPTSTSGRAMKREANKLEGASTPGTLIDPKTGKPFAKPVPVMELDTIKRENEKAARAGLKPEATGADAGRSQGHQATAEVIRDATNTASPNLRRARELYSDAHASKEQLELSALNKVVDPKVRASGTAEWKDMMPFLDSQGRNISRDIEFTAAHLNRYDKEAFPSLVKSWMQGKLAQSGGMVGGRADVRVLGEFPEAVAGAPGSVQRQNFNALIRGVARAQGQDPYEAVTGANKIMDALHVIAREQQGAGKIATSEVSREAGSNIISTAARAANPLTPMWAPAAALERKLRHRTYEKVVEALTSPDGARILREVAAWEPGDERFKALFQSMYRGMALGGAQAASQ